MKNRLSHSACSKYQQCPKSYYYHYIEGLRDKYSSAALLFGSAVDNAINALLKKEDKSAEEIFEASWNEGRISNNIEQLKESLLIVYSNTDYDKDLLEDEDFINLAARTGIEGKDNLLELYKTLSDRKKEVGFDRLSDEDKKVFNYFNWLSLRRKGLLMINAYRTKILPSITKVRAVQKYIEIKNEDGDKVIGYVDLVADWKDEGTVIFDLKTSSIEYAEGAVLTSPQLTLYVHALQKEYNTRKAGFLVLKKQVDKNRVKICSQCKFDGSGARHKTCSNEIGGNRCGGTWTETIRPEIRFQILIDEIPDQTESIVLENYDDINHAIKAEQFHRNLNSCVQPWGKCSYYNLCYKGKEDGLVRTKK